MNKAYSMQKFQDWFTQQWVILRGQKIDPQENTWLLGPFGELNGIGEDFIDQLAAKEKLHVIRNSEGRGLLDSIHGLGLSEADLNNLSKSVVDFYEHTANYKLQFQVKWKPYFKFFGFLVNNLFSQRINQLNIPTKNTKEEENITSEIIQLINPDTHAISYTIWLRKFESTGKVIYSGIYGTCILPSGFTCIKAVFPLPKGNATVIMKPSVGAKNELILDSSGKQFGDAGFYFLLNDVKGAYWARFISSFTDQLVINQVNQSIKAKQILKLWHLKVVEFNYHIENKLYRCN